MAQATCATMPSRWGILRPGVAGGVFHGVSWGETALGLKSPPRDRLCGSPAGRRPPAQKRSTRLVTLECEVGISQRPHFWNVETFKLGFPADADRRDQVAELEPDV